MTNVALYLLLHGHWDERAQPPTVVRDTHLDSFLVYHITENWGVYLKTTGEGQLTVSAATIRAFSKDDKRLFTIPITVPSDQCRELFDLALVVANQYTRAHYDTVEIDKNYICIQRGDHIAMSFGGDQGIRTVNVEGLISQEMRQLIGTLHEQIVRPGRETADATSGVIAPPEFGKILLETGLPPRTDEDHGHSRTR